MAKLGQSKDLLKLILKNIPVKRLGEFKIVNRQWKFMLLDGNFTNILQQLCKTKVFFFSELGSPNLPCTVEIDGLDRDHQSISKSPLEIVGSCMGLICLADVLNRMFIVFNLASMKTWTIQKHEPGSSSYSFGFDNTSEKFKVVQMVNYNHNYPSEAMSLSSVEVLDLKSVGWTRIQSSCSHFEVIGFPEIYDNGFLGIYVKGKIYWGVILNIKDGSHLTIALSADNTKVEAIQVGGCCVWKLAEVNRWQRYLTVKTEVSHIISFLPIGTTADDIYEIRDGETILAYNVKEESTRILFRSAQLDMDEDMGFIISRRWNKVRAISYVESVTEI